VARGNDIDRRKYFGLKSKMNKEKMSCKFLQLIFCIKNSL